MAHQQQQEFFRGLAVRFSDQFNKASRILEVGSQNRNGSVRQYFPGATEYLGLDLGIALDVDWAVPGELVELPNGWAEIVISTECFEHCKDWDKVFINMMRIAEPGGLVIVTCAAPGRPAHGTIDSDEYSSPFTTSYYRNLGVDDITDKIKLGHYFRSHSFEVSSTSHDLYFWGIRSEVYIQPVDMYWEDPMSRLARAQGQLAQAAARHSAIQSELYKVKNRAEQAKADAEQAKADAEQAKADAEQAKADAEQAKAEAEQAKANTLNPAQASGSWAKNRILRRSAEIIVKLIRKGLGIRS